MPASRSAIECSKCIIDGGDECVRVQVLRFVCAKTGAILGILRVREVEAVMSAAAAREVVIAELGALKKPKFCRVQGPGNAAAGKWPQTCYPGATSLR